MFQDAGFLVVSWRLCRPLTHISRRKFSISQIYIVKKNEKPAAVSVLNKHNAPHGGRHPPARAKDEINIIMCVKKFCVSVALHYLCTQKCLYDNFLLPS